MAHQELAVAELANVTSWLLPVSVDAATGEHTLLRHAVLTVAIATELAEVHLRVFLKDGVSAADTGTRSDLFAIWTVQEEDWVLIIDLKLVCSNAHHAVLPFEAFNSCC